MKQTFTPDLIFRKPDYRIMCKAETKIHALVQHHKRRRLDQSSTENYLTVAHAFHSS